MTEPYNSHIDKSFSHGQKWGLPFAKQTVGYFQNNL